MKILQTSNIDTNTLDFITGLLLGLICVLSTAFYVWVFY